MKSAIVAKVNNPRYFKANSVSHGVSGKKKLLTICDYSCEFKL